MKYGTKDNWELQKAYWAQSISLSSTNITWRRSSIIIAPGSSLLGLQKGITQSPTWLDDKGVRMDWNAEECDETYQRVDEKMVNKIGDLK